MSQLPRRLRALRRQIEIIVLDLLARLLRVRRLGGFRARWAAAAVAAVVLAAGLTVALLPRATARSAAVQTSPGPAAGVLDEPSPPAGAISAEAFAGAARRAPATAPLQRLPQVDLNGLSVSGIPPAALAAYVTAARTTNQVDAGCHVRWWLLAGIGLVESAHAHSGGSAAAKWSGIARPPIYGPRLDGKHGFAAIRDTDGGVLDRDKTWDRAVGPMQFIPSTWSVVGVDADGDGTRNPQDIRAAAMAAAAYLCAGGADLSQSQGMATAVFSYNHSFDYVRLVLSVAARYAGLSPDALGVNRLPHDKPAAKKPGKPGAATSPTTAPSSASTGGGASPAASPSPSNNTSPAAPSPSPTSPSLPPLPTPTSVFH